MPMKNPPHPGGFVLRQCIEPLGLSITARRRRARSHAHHAIGTGEREARHFSRNGRDGCPRFSAAAPKAGLCNRRNTILHMFA